MSIRRRFGLLCALLVSSICFAPQPQAYSQELASDSKLDESLVKTLDELRAKIRRLEAAMADKSMAKGKGMGMGKGKGMAKGKGMGMAKGKDMAKGKGMGMAKGKDMAKGKGKGMGMGKGIDKANEMAMGGGMAGKGMMGRGPKMDSMPMQSALPGFPGASHIYHIGATGFFLNHAEHITLTADQQRRLNDIKTKALLANATFERQIDESEQQMWTLTAAAEPDIVKIEANVGEIAKLTGKRRLAFIRRVGKAAAVLTDDQRQKLVGEHAPDDPPESANSIE